MSAIEDGSGAPLLEGAPPKKGIVAAIRSDLGAFKDLLTDSWANLLLICLPLGFACGHYGFDPIASFMLNLIGIIPLALVLGNVTEDLAIQLGDTVGGLLMATVGNLVEMILATTALFKGLYDVVALSMIGSVLSNLLLVLGSCFLVGGFWHKIQEFNKVSNRACNSLLFLSIVMVLFPAAADIVEEDDNKVLLLSRGTAVVMALMYVGYLLFQMKTHNELFQEDDEEQEEPKLSFPGAFFMLFLISMLVSVASEFLTDSITDMSDKSGISKVFLSVTILPIAGNACESVTAISVAAKNKMDLALSVAVGSSIQIAIFVIPFVVLMGWAFGTPGHGSDFTLGLAQFDTFAILSLVCAVVHTNFVTADGYSHWLMGVQLIASYFVIALTFFIRTDTMDPPAHQNSIPIVGM